ncbi:MAG: bifunctional folylpolyglutamate synthase/dihydrofolate synthase [Leucobacter sp.]|nr:bifunctional folylpolyglutamate synthase/dihydrofolate synthase [Leucobacter sp.]
MTTAERAADRVYDELLERVGEANPRPRLEPVRRLAELVGTPQLSYPVIQIAGTNGKTSTARAVESLLRAQGLRTGLFTSPHLVAFTERIQLDGEPVGGNVLADAWAELQLPMQVLDAQLEQEGQGPITFFEALAVLAFAVFADAPVDVAVLEVGMGGEWDATNIADAQVAVFTPIDLDHTAHLGRDIETIARTKAGIIKPAGTVVSAVPAPEAIVEIVEAAEAQSVGFFLADRDFGVGEDLLAVGGRQLELQGLHGHRYDPVFVGLYGAHQAQNVALAVAAVEVFFGAERPIPQEVLEEGLGQLTSPGRLQLISADPIVYVDAAHNPHGAEALARAVTESFAFTELTLVAGALSDKDAYGVLEALAPIASQMLLTPVSSSRSMTADDLERVAREFEGQLSVSVAASLHESLEIARAWARKEDGRAVLVTGSVLLVGEALTLAQDEGWGDK